MQAVSPEYREIVNRCLAETTNEMIDFIEKNFVRTRRGHAGEFLEYTKNFLAASINHEVLMQQQKLFGSIARSKLASKLQREGIE